MFLSVSGMRTDSISFLSSKTKPNLTQPSLDRSVRGGPNVEMKAFSLSIDRKDLARSVISEKSVIPGR